MGMGMYMYWTAAVVFIGAVATIMIGISKQNKEGSPSYDTKTKEYLIRITTIYAITIVASAIALFAVFR